MKQIKNILLFLLILSFLAFSCKGTPKVDVEGPNLSLEELTLPEDLEIEEEAGQEPQELADISDTDDAQDSSADLSEVEETAAPEIAIAPEPAAPEPVSEPEPEPVPAPVVQAVTDPAPAPRTPPPVPPPALLGPAEERPSVSARPPSAPSREPAAQSPSAQTPTAPASEAPASGTASSPTVSAIRDNPPVPARSAPVIPERDEINFSRIVRATVGQIVEIPFRGTGWVYLGELASRRGIVYDSRRIDPEGQSFIFKAEEAGTYALKFYRQDFIRDYILNDYVQVIVGEAPQTAGAGWFSPPVDRGRVTALPRWPSALEESAILRGGSPSKPAGEDPNTAQSSGAAGTRGSPSDAIAYVEPASGRAARENTAQPPVQGDAAPSAPRQTVPARPQDSSAVQNPVAPQNPAVTQNPAAPQTSAPAQTAAPSQTSADSADAESQERLSLDDALQKAKESFDGGNVAAAIALLNRYREYYPSGSDELYWLLGQFYEANTPSRDILLSLDYYRRLVDEYPQSRRYNDARRRIAYLERFYIRIQ